MSAWFVTGIDTGTGKTLATGLLARHLLKTRGRVITMKLAQTGCDCVPEDIETHRKLMGTGMLPEDSEGLTCPYIFRLPASPHLAAKVEGAAIDTGKIASAALELEKRYGTLLVEGVGGWLVPLTETETAADFAARMGWPAIVVSSPRLGSINHTLLTINAIKAAGVTVAGVLYNQNDDAHPVINTDTREIIRDALIKMGMRPAIVDIPAGVDINSPPDVDFSEIFA